MDKITEEENKIKHIIRDNLRLLIEQYGLTVSSFCQYIQNEGECALDRTTFTKFMNNPERRINIAFLVSCSRVFDVPLDKLINADFNPEESGQKFQEKYKDILKKKPGMPVFNFKYSSNEIFVENPDSPLLKNYMQTYHCYYHSTVSSENSTDDIQKSLIYGTLVIEPNDGKCRATLTIDTKRLDENKQKIYKIYSGDVVLCPSIQSIHCILVLPEGEFCFIIFRYSHLNHAKQECRLAEVLSTSSMPDKRCPIVHRMLLSNEKIKDEDLEAIAPHLWLNSTEILAGERGLSALAELSDSYKQIVQEVLQNDSECMYRIKENVIKEIAEKYLNSEEVPTFITKLRYYSYAKRYNKVNSAADKGIRDMLLQRKYFHESS